MIDSSFFGPVHKPEYGAFGIIPDAPYPGRYRRGGRLF
jgi:hypothetical protein